MKSDHWDPAPHEKSYYRHITTGDLGWMVRREGKDSIKLDRPAQEIVRVYREDEWIPELEHRPLTKYQLAQIAFEADRKLCFFLGRHSDTRREWLTLRDEERIAWTNLGPEPTGPRRRLFNAIMAALHEFTGK